MRRTIIIILIAALILLSMAACRIDGGGGDGGNCSVDSNGNWHCPEDHVIEQAREVVQDVNQAASQYSHQIIQSATSQMGSCNAKLEVSKGLPVAGDCR